MSVDLSDGLFESSPFRAVYVSLSVSVWWSKDFHYVSASDLYLKLQAMYPTVIVLLVESQRSVMDNIAINPSVASKLAGPVPSETCSEILGHFSFVTWPIDNTMENKPESQHSRASESQDGQECGLGDPIEPEIEVKESQVGITWEYFPRLSISMS